MRNQEFCYGWNNLFKCIQLIDIIIHCNILKYKFFNKSIVV